MKREKSEKLSGVLDQMTGYPINMECNLNNMDEVVTQKPTLLLHSCCGPCSTSVIERLGKTYRIIIYFYNPNILDREEYDRRKESQISFIDQYNDEAHHQERITFLEGPWDREAFLKVVSGLEREPEGAKRCNQCFRLRLEKTAETARIQGCDYFSTTLTVSPHKDYELISQLGKQMGIKYKVSFLDENFKKQDGYKRSIELSKKYNLYRQNYCGCGL